MGNISNRARYMLAVSVAVVVAAGLGPVTVANAGSASPGDTFPVSYLDLPDDALAGSFSGQMGPGYSVSPLSSDARYVFFVSDSDNLAPGNNPDVTGLYRRDNQTGDVVLVGRADGPEGIASDKYIESYSASSNGNLVAFVTSARLDPADSDNFADIYLRNIQTSTTTQLTPGTADDFSQVDISGDGAYVAFSTDLSLAAGDLNSVSDVYRMTVSDGTAEIVSAISGTLNAGNADSLEPSISGNGGWVAFSSSATNLAAGFMDGNGPFASDVWVRNVGSDTTHLVSSRYNLLATSGNGGSSEPVIAGSPAILNDVTVAYDSYATNLRDNVVTDTDTSSSVYLRDYPTNASELISRATGLAGANADSRAHTPSISDDGTRVTFSSDAGNLGPALDYYGSYLRDRPGSTTSMISARNSYAVYAEISGDGSTVSWAEEGGATVDSDPVIPGVFIRSLPAGEIRFVSRPAGNQRIFAAAVNSYDENQSRRMSSDGRFVVFSGSSSLLPGWDGNHRSQVYRRDLQSGEVQLVSRANGTDGPPSESSSDGTISADGNLVAFTSGGISDPADTNSRQDVFIRNMSAGTTTLVSRQSGVAGTVGDDGSRDPVISGDGNRIAFVSDSSNLGGPGGTDSIYVRNLTTSETYYASRQSGPAGTSANFASGGPQLDFTGSKVVFYSYANNLSPDDPTNSSSIYLRDLGSNETSLLSRRPGPSGTNLSDSTYDPTINGDGTRVAFEAEDQAAVPDSGMWPAGYAQIVVRNLTDGINQLASKSADGQPGITSSRDPSLSRDGNVIAFRTTADNIRPDISGWGSSSVVVLDMTNATISGPPKFGLTVDANGYSRSPVVSDDGNCVMFKARGHNGSNGDIGDINTDYMFVRSGSCLNPRQAVPIQHPGGGLLVVPKLTGVTLKPSKFRVSPKPTAVAARKGKKKRIPRGTKIGLNLNVVSTVIITIQRRTVGRKVNGKCIRQKPRNRKRKACTKYKTRGKIIRRDLKVGRTVIPFSGRIGNRALTPGRYQAVLMAARDIGRSGKVIRKFRIVKR